MMRTLLFGLGLFGAVGSGYALYALTAVGFALGGLIDGAQMVMPGMIAVFVSSCIFIAAAFILEAIRIEANATRAVIAKLSAPPSQPD